MPIAEKRFTVKLGGVERELFFNLNAMCKYEEATGKMFIESVASLQRAFTSAQNPEDPKKPVPDFEIVRRVSMVEFSALLWATMHEYDAQENPRWPVSLARVRKMIGVRPVALTPLLFAFLNGYISNSPDEAELGESRASSETPHPAAPAERVEPTKAADGGEASIELPEAAFA